MLLIVSSMSALVARYGSVGAANLRARMEDLERDLSQEAGRVFTIFPDDKSSASRIGVNPTAMNSPGSVAQALWSLYRAIDFSPQDALLLLGGDAVIPFAQMSNPAHGGSDPDSILYSDNPYGFSPDRALQAFQTGATPDLAVSRLPDFEPADLQGFLALIECLVNAPATTRIGTFAVVNAAWLSPTIKLLDGFGTVRTTPPWSCANSEWKAQDAQLLYFNLHGFLNESAWRGFDDWSGNWCDAMTPSDVNPDAVTGTIVFAENCYGAHVSGKSAQNSIAMAMLAAGARTFVGSTGLAYGSFYQLPDTPIEADVMGGNFVRNLRTGFNAGHAMVSARATFAELTGPVMWEAAKQKTVTEFVMYGNPLATL